MGKGALYLFPGQEVFSMQKEAVDKMVLHFVTAPFVWALSLADPFSKKESGLRFFTKMMVLRFFHEQCYLS